MPTLVPNYPAAIMVNDKQGGLKWTVSIPDDLARPLSGSEYGNICAASLTVSKRVGLSVHAKKRPAHIRYTDRDPNYLDITEAQDLGVLRTSTIHHSSTVHQDDNLPICKRSLTYVFDTAEAGMGQTLLGLWMSYGLAHKEQRTFFIDDTHFAYGSMSSLFLPSVIKPDCRPPAWNARTPCPRTANHLIVGSTTLKYTFDKTFKNHFDTKDIFDMARTGYDALFRLRADDHNFVKTRIAELRKPLDEQRNSVLIGLHIRRGDRHPFEQQYEYGYTPTSEYIAEAQRFVKRHGLSTIILATDDTDIYTDPEMEGVSIAQQQIELPSNNPALKEIVGWEGGFFADAFWDTGSLSTSEASEVSLHHSHDEVENDEDGDGEQEEEEGTHQPKPKSNPKTQPKSKSKSKSNPLSLDFKINLARSYLRDIAIISSSDHIVCGVSSNTCRTLGVMMGWGKLAKGKWKNIDGEFGWMGLDTFVVS